MAEHAIVISEDAERDEQDKIAKYENGPEEPIDDVVAKHLQEQGQADDGKHDVGIQGDVWVPAGASQG